MAGVTQDRQGRGLRLFYVANPDMDEPRTPSATLPPMHAPVRLLPQITTQPLPPIPQPVPAPAAAAAPPVTTITTNRISSSGSSSDRSSPTFNTSASSASPITPDSPTPTDTLTRRNLHVLVTGDNVSWWGVDLSKATNGASIREMIYTALRVPDEDHDGTGIFKTRLLSPGPEGEALSNTELLKMCEQYGDSDGGLRFAVGATGFPRSSAVPPPPPPPELSVPITAIGSTPMARYRSAEITGRDGLNFDAMAGYEASDEGSSSKRSGHHAGWYQGLVTSSSSNPTTTAEDVSTPPLAHTKYHPRRDLSYSPPPPPPAPPHQPFSNRPGVSSSSHSNYSRSTNGVIAPSRPPRALPQEPSPSRSNHSRTPSEQDGPAAHHLAPGWMDSPTTQRDQIDRLNYGMAIPRSTASSSPHTPDNNDVHNWASPQQQMLGIPSSLESASSFPIQPPPRNESREPIPLPGSAVSLQLQGTPLSRGGGNSNGNGGPPPPPPPPPPPRQRPTRVPFGRPPATQAPLPPPNKRPFQVPKFVHSPASNASLASLRQQHQLLQLQQQQQQKQQQDYVQSLTPPTPESNGRSPFDGSPRLEQYPAPQHQSTMDSGYRRPSIPHVSSYTPPSYQQPQSRFAHAQQSPAQQSPYHYPTSGQQPILHNIITAQKRPSAISPRSATATSPHRLTGARSHESLKQARGVRPLPYGPTPLSTSFDRTGASMTFDRTGAQPPTSPVLASANISALSLAGQQYRRGEQQQQQQQQPQQLPTPSPSSPSPMAPLPPAGPTRGPPIGRRPNTSESLTSPSISLQRHGAVAGPRTTPAAGVRFATGPPMAIPMPDASSQVTPLLTPSLARNQGGMGWNSAGSSAAGSPPHRADRPTLAHLHVPEPSVSMAMGNGATSPSLLSKDSDGEPLSAAALSHSNVVAGVMDARRRSIERVREREAVREQFQQQAQYLSYPPTSPDDGGGATILSTDHEWLAPIISEGASTLTASQIPPFSQPMRAQDSRGSSHVVVEEEEDSGTTLTISSSRSSIRTNETGTSSSGSSSSGDSASEDGTEDGTLWQNPAVKKSIAQLREAAMAQEATDAAADAERRASKPALPPLQTTITNPDHAWLIRPNTDVLYEHIDRFFPKVNLDEPVIVESTPSPTNGDHNPQMFPPMSSSTAAPPPTPTAMDAVASPRDRSHRKSIRVVADERSRKIKHLLKGGFGGKNNEGKNLGRRVTRFWGNKVEELPPHAANSRPVTAAQEVKVPDTPTTAQTTSSTPDRPMITFRWVRGDLIGRGSYGRVYHAMNVNTGEIMAVKQVELPKTPSDHDDKRQATVVEALKLESATLSTLDHPHVVQYLGFEETPDFLSIFLEYVPGGSIGGCMRKYGKFSEDIIKSFTRQVTDGLAYLHEVGIIHRDLKGDNILLDPSGVCKITDFGISRHTEDIYSDASHTVMQGSIYWMAPEVITNQAGGYSAKIDVWSMGCVVLEMWAGRRPWSTENQLSVMFKLSTSKTAPPVPDDVHLGELAEDFRAKCFAIDPALRPTAAELVTHPYLVLPSTWTFPGFPKQEDEDTSIWGTEP